MDRKKFKVKKIDERKKAAKFKKGSRYNCNVCGMEISAYEPCECLAAGDMTYYDEKMILT